MLRGRPIRLKDQDKKERDKSGEERSRAQVKDFVPWVHPKPSRPSASKEEEDEEEITGLLDRYAARKRKRQEDVEREADQADESSRLPRMGVQRCRRSSFRALQIWGLVTSWVRRMSPLRSQGWIPRSRLHCK